MTLCFDHSKKSRFLAVRKEFILKVDGGRPILYPLDFIDIKLFTLDPIEGFALSLLNGRRTLQQVTGLFLRFFPGSDAGYLEATLEKLDRDVRERPSAAGIGSQGVIECADSEIADAPLYDPRDFVVSPDDFSKRMSDVRMKVRLDTPICIYTIFTHRCPVDCVYCYAERKKVPEMPLSRWRDLIREMHGLGIRLCAPDNGDTFARSDGVDLLECLLEHEMLFLLSTKSHLSRDVVRRLVDAGFREKFRGAVERPVQLSVDAVDEHVEKQVQRVPHRLEKMKETFDNFLSAGMMPRIKAVITQLNADQPRKLVDAFYPRGARQFHFTRYARSYHRHDDRLFLTRDSYELLARQFEEIRGQYPDIDLAENVVGTDAEMESPGADQKKKLWDNRIGCGGGWFSLGISADGSGFLCEQMKIDEAFTVGDLSTQSIMDVWKSRKMSDFIHPPREKFRDTLCYSCEDFESCIWEKGRCYRNAYFSYGSIYHPPPLCPKNTKPGLRMS